MFKAALSVRAAVCSALKVSLSWGLKISLAAVIDISLINYHKSFPQTVLVNKNGPITSGHFCPGGRRALSTGGVALVAGPRINEGDLFTGTMQYGGGSSKCSAFQHFNGATVDLSLQVVDLTSTGSGDMYNMIGAANTQTSADASDPVACLQQQFFTVSSYGDGQSILKPQASTDYDYAQCTNSGIPQPYGYYCSSSSVDFLTCHDTAGCITVELSRLSDKALAEYKKKVHDAAAKAGGNAKKCLPLGERECGTTTGCAYCVEKTSSGDYNSACCPGAMGQAVLPCKDNFGATLHQCNA